MSMSSERWKQITPSQFPWERDALDYVRERLPDIDPYRAWANFEFIADDGTINEVDLLVLTPRGFFLIEIKSKPGILGGDRATWVWTHEGRSHTEDNPIILANRKAKKLASLLKRQKACQKTRFPYLEPLIFCSHEQLDCRLQGVDRYRVCLRDREQTLSRPAVPGIIAALKFRKVGGLTEGFEAVLDRPIAGAVSRAIEQAGIRPSQKSRRVGDFILGRLLFDSPTGTYQDWEASHSTLTNTVRRVRIYSVAAGTPAVDRETIRKASKREFELLEGLHHPGILQVLGYTEHELGPALVFRHDPEAIRLDHFLAQSGGNLNVGDRINLTRQIAEALKYAHEKRVVHRALSPQSVLVCRPESHERSIRIFNWQTGLRLASTSSSKGLPLITPTLHPEQLIEDAATVYMAPEAITEPGGLGEHLDIFSLGAIAYHIFTGQSPAENVFALSEKLRGGSGLTVTSLLDGAISELEELIQFSTFPSVSARYESVSDFLEQLDRVEDKLTSPEKDTVDNPLDAHVGEKLEGGFVLRGRLGSGSSAVVILVEKDGKEMVLKLANKSEHNDRIREEASSLQKLRHQNVVELFDEVEINGLVGFTMDRAGDKTLAKRLRSEGRLHLDLLERFGEELIQTVRHLEQVGIPHRDIKPDNIGVRPFGKNETLGIVLFDFSLSRTPMDNIRAGTAPYLEPFLSLRKPPRWDVYAERYALTVTLYEMATGKLPRWGDGQSDPALLDDEVTLETEYFDPDLREGMSKFFAKALRRNYRERFDNCDEMVRAWRGIFEQTETARQSGETGEEFGRAAALATANVNTQIAFLGLSTRAKNALDRLNVITVKDLLGLPLTQINRLPGVGNKTRREIASLVLDLRLRFPEAESAVPRPIKIESDTEALQPEVASVDLISEQLKTAGVSGPAETRILYAFLGFDSAHKAGEIAWPSQMDAATNLGITRARVSQVVSKVRERWRKNPSITALRQTIDVILNANAGVMSIAELSDAVLTARGSVYDEPMRSRLAAIVTRAAVETETSLETPRFLERRGSHSILIVKSSDLADYAERLAKQADRIADSDPLVPPARVVEGLRAVETPPGCQAPMDTRLVRLASSASSRAAVSSRLELYPRSMPASRALKLCHGALLGARELTVEEIRKRVASRYPEAESLPERPELDSLLQGLDLDLQWNAAAVGGKGAYVIRIEESKASSASLPSRMPTLVPQIPSSKELGPEILDAKLLESKLQRANVDGTFLVLTVVPKGLEAAERELTRRFGVKTRNLDEILIRLMRRQAETAKADWNIVLRADAAERDSQDWRNLMILVSRTIPILEEELFATQGTVLLVYPGLLARYDRLDILERLRDGIISPAGTGAPLRGLWLLIPSDEQNALPTIDLKPVPVISSNQWARIPEAWLANAHRGRTNGDQPRKAGQPN